MTIFSRYVFRQTGGALLLILLSLTGIVWISLALRELNVVTSMGQSALTLIKMTTLGAAELHGHHRAVRAADRRDSHAEPPEQRQRDHRAHGVGRDRLDDHASRCALPLDGRGCSCRSSTTSHAVEPAAAARDHGPGAHRPLDPGHPARPLLEPRDRV